MKAAGPGLRPLKTAAAAAAAAGALCGLLAFAVPLLLTTRSPERDLTTLRARAKAIQREFAALAREVEQNLDALTRRSLPASTEGRFRRLEDLRLDQDVEGAALYGPDKRLKLWIGRVFNLEDLMSGPSPELTPSARPKMLLVRDIASSDLALVHQTEEGDVVVVYRLLDFSPELRSAYIQEYSFLPPRLRSRAHLGFLDFSEDISGFERIFARSRDEYIGQSQLQSEVQSLIFPLRTAEGRIVAHVSLNSQTRQALKKAYRDGFLLAAGLAFAVSLVLFSISVLGWPSFRARRAAPALALIAALAAFRGLFLLLSRLRTAGILGFFSPARAGFISFGWLTSSPADLFLTGLVFVALALLAADYVWPRTRTTDGGSRSLVRSAAWIPGVAAAPFLVAGVGWLTARLVENSSLNLLRFDITAAFLAVQASLLFAGAGVLILVLSFLKSALAASASVFRPAAILGISSASLVVLGARRLYGPLVIGAGVLVLAFLFAAARRPAIKKAAAIALVPGFVLFLYAGLDRETQAKTRLLGEGLLRDTILAHGHWTEFFLSESLQNLDREEKTLLAFLGNPEARPGIARRLWETTTAARFNAYSGLEIYDSEGAALDRFSLNVSKITDEALSLPARPDWTISRIVKPFMGKTKEFLVAHRDWKEDGRGLGRLVFYISLDYDTLPFLYSANPYFELLRTNALPSLVQFDFRFAVFDAAGRILFNPARIATGLPAAILRSPEIAAAGIRTRFVDKGIAYELYAFGADGRIIALLTPRRGFIRRAVDFFKLLVLDAALLFLPLLLGSLAVPRRGRRHVLWSFANRVYISFIAVALAPLVLFTFASRPFFNRVFAQQFIDKAEVHATMARNVMDDFVYFQAEERALIESQPEELALYLSTSISNDVNLYQDGRLLSSSRREFFDSGLLPELLDGETYYKLQFANDPFATRTRRLGRFSYQTLTVPYTSLEPPLLISLPFPFEAQEIGEANRSLVEFLFFLSAFFIAVVLLLARAIGSMIVTPIRRLLAGTREAALGNLEFAVPYGRQDEMKGLIDGFNAMIRSLKDHQRELADLGKKAAWAEMARKVAHEIKNPLTPIQLSAEHLLRVYEDGRGDFGPALKESITYIISEVENLRQIAQGFLDHSKESILHKEVIPLDDFVREIVEPYRKLLQSRIAFREAYGGAGARVEGDKAKLKIALRNLLINAVEAIRGPGEVRITTAAAEGRVEVVLEDTGIGIEKDVLDRIFEPYFSTKDVGTGLGLPIARKIVEDHGGAIRIASEPGCGTRVAIELPLSSG